MSEENEKIAKIILHEIVPIIRDEIKSEIKLVVNGKIDRLTDAVGKIHERLDEQDVNMAPAIETIDTIKSGRKFLLWIAPVLAAIGVIVTFFKDK